MEKSDGPALSKGRANFGSLLGVTPKAACASRSGVRPFIGRFSICRVLITCPMDAVAVSSSEASAETMTICSSPPFISSMWALPRIRTMPLPVLR